MNAFNTTTIKSHYQPYTPYVNSCLFIILTIIYFKISFIVDELVLRFLFTSLYLVIIYLLLFQFSRMHGKVTIKKMAGNLMIQSKFMGFIFVRKYNLLNIERLRVVKITKGLFSLVFKYKGVRITICQTQTEEKAKNLGDKINNLISEC
jgi:hypothetical protein